MNNIDFIKEDVLYCEDRPCAWNKIPMTKKYLSSYDYVFWSDADVLIKNYDFDLRKYIEDKNDWDFVFSKCVWGVNSGNFFVKNTDSAIKMLDLIYSQTEFLNHGWWEQMAIIHLLETHEDFKSSCFIEENSRLFNAYTQDLNERSPEFDQQKYQDGDFLIHYAGIDTDSVRKLMREDLS